MRVLIVYGSRHDGTHGLADMIADALAERNFSTRVQPAGQFTDLADADAVIVAGALYMGRWHRDAVRFVRHHAKTLRGLPLWLVSSGPLDDSATNREIPPVRQVVRLAASVGARGHVTFGGRLLPDTGGMLAGAMAQEHAGDWRDPEHVRRWVAGVAAELAAIEASS